MDMNIDLYTDYLLSSGGKLVTATELSAILDNQVSHDQVTRFLSGRDFSSKDLWHLVKKYVRQVDSEDAVLIIDDTIEPKPYTDEDSVICWHYDHVSGKNVKGINIVTCVYYANESCFPISYDIVEKKAGQQYSREMNKPATKNEMFREILSKAVGNNLKFQMVLSDRWYSSAENMKYIVYDLDRDFIMPIKSNRLVALTEADIKAKKFCNVEEVDFQGTAKMVWLRGVHFPVLVHKQIFTNKDGSTGVLYLATSDLRLTRDDIVQIYQKRWNIECFHKSLKQNAGLTKSPTRRVRTQCNHVCLAILAVAKLEKLRLKMGINQFALKARLYQNAVKSALNMVFQIENDTKIMFGA